MLILKNQLLVAGITLVFATQANAIVHFEPLVGYQLQNLKLTNLTQTSQNIKSNSVLFGAKIGLRIPVGISLDAVGTYSSGKTQTTPTVTENPEFTHIVGSVQLGVSALDIMKLSLGYIFQTQYELKKSQSIPSQKLSGDGYQAGISFYVLKNWSLSFNYNVHQFKKLNGAAFVNGDNIKNYYSASDLSDVSAIIGYTF